MDHARHQFLAGAGFALDHHRGIGGRHAHHLLINLDHGRGAADHHALRQFLFLGFGFGIVARRLGPGQRVEQGVEFERLGDIFEGSAAGGGHHGFHRPAAGHQDDRAARVLALGGIQHVQAGALVDIDIGEDDRVGGIAQTLHGLARGGHRVHRIPLRLQRREDGEIQIRIVFD